MKEQKNICKWHNKPLCEVTEYEQEQCTEKGMDCNYCCF